MGCGSSTEAEGSSSYPKQPAAAKKKSEAGGENQTTVTEQKKQPDIKLKEDKAYDPYAQMPSYDQLYGEDFNPYAPIEGKHEKGDVIIKGIKGKDPYKDKEDEEEEKEGTSKLKKKRLQGGVVGLADELDKEMEEAAKKLEEERKAAEEKAKEEATKIAALTEEEEKEKSVKESEVIGGIVDQDMGKVMKEIGKSKDQFVECRSNPEESRGREVSAGTTKPSVSSGEKYEDPAFPRATALGKHDSGDLEWKRPTEFKPDAVLFADGTSRFDIVQGSFGTCYFLSIVSAIGDKPELVKRMFPDDAWNPETGVVHVRFFWMGKWEDVYTDDYLPVAYGTTPWGARSSDENEMWVSLLEKAYARFWGSYSIVEAGQPENAFVLLTGGTAEPNDTKGADKAELWERIRNGISCGAIVSGSVPDELDGQNGLAGGHAYSVTGATKVQYRGAEKRLIRVRNPWGKQKGEWEGPWSDGSSEWDYVSAEVKDKLVVAAKGDGEFWMTMPDYVRHFRSACICNITPDADGDGDPDPLYFTHNVCSEFRPGFDGGPNSLQNPRFLVSVPKGAVDKATGLCPMVVQIMQDANRKDPLSTRVDVYRVVDKSKDNSRLVLDDLTTDTVFWADLIRSSRYQVPAGDYLIVPKTFKKGDHLPFCLRVFTQAATTLKALDDNLTFFMGNLNDEIMVRQQVYKVDKQQTFMGRFEPGVNSGGQVGHDSCSTSPQYQVKIVGSGNQPVRITFMQATRPENQHAIGYAIYPLSGEHSLPLDTQGIYRIHDSRIKGQFIRGWASEGVHLLKPGRYMLFIYTDKPDVDVPYSLAIRSKDKLSIQGFNLSN